MLSLLRSRLPMYFNKRDVCFTSSVAMVLFSNQSNKTGVTLKA